MKKAYNENPQTVILSIIILAIILYNLIIKNLGI